MSKRIVVIFFSLLLCVGLSVSLAYLDWRTTILLPLGISVIVFEIIRKKERKWDFLTLFNAMFILSYIVAPFVMLNAPDRVNRFIELQMSDVLTSIAVIYISYFLIVTGYYMFRKKSVKEQREEFQYNKIMHHVAWILLLVGVVSFIGYAQVYGGVMNLFKMGTYIRSGYNESSGMVALSFFNNCATVACWIFYSLVHSNPQNKKWMRLTFLASLLISLFIVFSKSGRLNVLFVLIPIMYMKYQTKLPKMRTLITFSTVLIVWTLFGKQLYTNIAYGTTIQSYNLSDSFFSFINEFTHPFTSLQVAIRSVPYEVSYRGLLDFYSAIMSLLPERLLQVSAPPSVSYYNSYLILDRFESNIPPGLIAYFYYAFSWAGVVVGCLGFGFIMRRVEQWLIKMQDKHKVFACLYVAVAFIFTYATMQGDPRVVVMSYFWVLGSMIVIITGMKMQDKFKRQLKHKFNYTR